MGTTGTITGVRSARAGKPHAIVGLQPEEGAVPGIRPLACGIHAGHFNAQLVDQVLDIHHAEAEYHAPTAGGTRRHLLRG